MMSSAKTTAITKLVSVFRKHGYTGTTMAMLSQSTGLGKASLYHHFPGGKEEMGEAVLQAVDQIFAAEILMPLRSQEYSPQVRLENMGEGLLNFYHQGQLPCLLALFSIGDADERFHAHLRKSLVALLKSIAALLAETGVAPVIAQERAENAIIQVQGALVVSRILESTAPFQRIVRELPAQLLAEA